MMEKTAVCMEGRRASRTIPHGAEIASAARRVSATVARLPVSIVLFLVLCLSLPAAPKRRAVQHPGALTREAIIATASRVADHVTLSFHPRLHWENAVYFDGLVLL